MRYDDDMIQAIAERAMSEYGKGMGWKFSASAIRFFIDRFKQSGATTRMECIKVADAIMGRVTQEYVPRILYDDDMTDILFDLHYARDTPWWREQERSRYLQVLDYDGYIARASESDAYVITPKGQKHIRRRLAKERASERRIAQYMADDALARHAQAG